MNPNQVAARVVPSLGPGVSVTAHATPWQYGNYTEVIAVDVEQDQIVPLAVSVESASAEATYQMELSCGDDDTICGVCRFTKGNFLNGIKVDGSAVPPKARVRARMASSTGGGTVVFSLSYQPTKSVAVS